MDIQINTSNAVDGPRGFTDAMEATTRSRLARFEGRLTRVELHFSDTNAARDTVDDKRCAIEARLAGGDPITVTNEAATLDQAVTGALTKMATALDRHIGKSTTRKGH